MNAALDKEVLRPGDLVVWPDYLMLFGQRVNRPYYISRSDWINLWASYGPVVC